MALLFVRPCVNETPVRDVYWAAIHFKFATWVYCTVLHWGGNHK